MTTFFGDEVSEIAARRQLGQFLRDHRDALRPEQFGFVRGPRRRSRGLLRYEVAQLAAVSDTWYTWLEQGRDIHVSASSLDSIARALCLDEHARQHIRYLAGIPVAEPEREEFDVDVHLSDLVQEMDPHPACIAAGTFDLLVWNRAFELLYLAHDHPRPYGPNALWEAFSDPTFYDRVDDWENDMATLVARFRFEWGRQPGNQRFAELVEALHALSPKFTQLWSEARVRPAPRGTMTCRHPEFGLLSFRKVQLRVVDEPGLALTIQRAADEQTAHALRQLIEASRPAAPIDAATDTRG